MTRVFNGAILTVGGLALFVLGWYVGSQVTFPSVGELSEIERKATYEREEYTIRYPTDWKVVELSVNRNVVDVPVPTHHVAFNRQAGQAASTINDCTLEIRTFSGSASPSLEEWAKKVLGVVNPAFGGAVKFEKTNVGGAQGLQAQGGQDLFVEKSGNVFYLTAGTRIAESGSEEAGKTCKDSVNSMLRSFNLK